MEAVLNRLRDSVDRFDAHFQRAFDEYGRVESVREILDDRVVPHFILEQHSRVDFITASRQLQQRVQRVFDTKIRALRRLVRAAEKAAQKVDVDTELGPTLGSERLCRAQMRALNASLVHNSHIWRKSGGKPKSGVHVALETYKCSGAVKRDFDWTEQALIEQTMAENAQHDAALLRQYIGTYSGLTRMFPGFYWNVGPEQFSMDLFDPRFRPWFTAAESAPRDVLFLLDFSGSAKGLNVHLIKTSVMAVLQTLTPNDFFAGIWYNSRRELVLTNCTEPRGDTFVPATSRNKLLFRRFLDRLEERDQAVLPPAMEASFAQFVHAHHQNSSMEEAARPLRSGGHRLVLLFTDGIEFWPTDVVQRYQQHEKAHGSPPIRVFGHSIGHGRGVQSALTWLTCQTKAGLAQAEIGSVAEIRLKARVHLAKLSEVLALAYRERAADPERRPISWTNPYMDVQRGGAVLSLSMPLLGPQSAIYRDLNLSREQLMERRLDIGFAELARVMALEGEDGTLAYAFLVDNNGLVYFHPRLSTRPAELFAFRRTLCHRISTTLLRSNIRVPFSKADELVHQQLGYVDSVPHRDLLELEPDSPLMQQFRTRLVRRQCGTGEAPLEDAQRQLRCVPLKDTPLVIGMVLIKERARVSTSKQHFQNGREGVQEDEEDPFELAERFRAGFPTEDEPNEETANRRQFSPQNGNGSFAHQSVGILLTPGPIEQWELSTALSSARPLSRFRALIRLLPSVRPADPFLAHLSALAPDSVFPLWAASWNSTVSSVTSMRWPSSSASGSCAPRPLPPRIEPRLFRSAFLQIRASSLRDRAALTAFFPRCEFKSVNGIVQRTKPPPELADDDETGNGKLKIEVDLVDGGSADTILSVQKSMAFVANSIPLVQIGVQLRGNFFQLKFQRALQQQQGSWQECAKAGRKCLLISDDSVLLASSDPGFLLDAGVVHLSNAEPELFSELLSRGFIQKPDPKILADPIQKPTQHFSRLTT
uniref:VWFA domain-containing protein n=1 Tax=Globodera rostochiensis TaxID=31243 RepID=A0A914HEF3_GLORO